MEDRTQVLHKALTEKGLYTKTYEEFTAQFADPAKRDLLYNALQKSGDYTKSREEFDTQFFSETKKKSPLLNVGQGTGMGSSKGSEIIGTDQLPSELPKPDLSLETPALGFREETPETRLTKGLEGTLERAAPPRKTTPVGDMLRTLKSESLKTFGALGATPSMLNRTVQTATMKPIMKLMGASDEEVEQTIDYINATNTFGQSFELADEAQKKLAEKAKKVEEKIFPIQGGIWENLTKGEDGERNTQAAREQFWRGIFGSVPYLALTASTAGAGNIATLSTIGAVSATQQYHENEGMKSDDTRLLNSWLYGGFEAVGELVSGYIFRGIGKSFRQGVAKELPPARAKEMAKGIASSVGLEGSSEAVTQIGQNITDIVTGKDPNKNIFEGALDAATVGGLGFGLVGGSARPMAAVIGRAMASDKEVKQVNDKTQQQQVLIEQAEQTDSDPVKRALLKSVKDLKYEADEVMDENYKMAQMLSPKQKEQVAELYSVWNQLQSEVDAGNIAPDRVETIKSTIQGIKDQIQGIKEELVTTIEEQEKQDEKAKSEKGKEGATEPIPFAIGKEEFKTKKDLTEHLEKNALNADGSINLDFFDYKENNWPNPKTITAINEWVGTKNPPKPQGNYTKETPEETAARNKKYEEETQQPPVGSPSGQDKSIYNKQDVIESLLSQIPEESKEMMRGELASLPREEFEQYAKRAGFNSVGSHWVIGEVAKTDGVNDGVTDGVSEGIGKKADKEQVSVQEPIKEEVSTPVQETEMSTEREQIETLEQRISNRVYKDPDKKSRWRIKGNNFTYNSKKEASSVVEREYKRDVYAQQQKEQKTKEIQQPTQDAIIPETTQENVATPEQTPSGEGNVPPTPPTPEVSKGNIDNGKEKERLLLNRMHNAENLSEEFKKGVEKRGLTYESISNDVTAREVDYLIGEKGLNESEKVVLNTTNNIEPRVRALTATRLIKTLDELAGTAATPKEEFEYRMRSIEMADFIDNTARNWGRGIQILGSAEVNAMLSPKTQVIRIKKVVRAQRDARIEDNKKDIEKKARDLKDANEKSIDEVVGSREYEELKDRILELEKKLAEKPKPHKPPVSPKERIIQDKIKKEKVYIQSQWDALKKTLKPSGEMSSSAMGFSKEQIEIVGNIIAGYVRLGVYKAEDITSRLKKEWFKNTGQILSDDDVKKLLPEKIEGKTIDEIELEGEARDSADKLAARIERILQDAGIPKDDPVKQMINTLFEKVKEKDTKEKKPSRKSDIEKIRESLQNRLEYAEVWEQAKEKVLFKIESNTELSEEQKSEYNKRLAYFYGEVIGKPFSERQTESVVKNKLRELDTSKNKNWTHVFDKVIKDHYTVYDATKRTLQEKLVEELGLDGESAKLFSEAVGKQFDKIAIARKKAILKQGVTAKEMVKPKDAKQLHDKLIELTNMGAFSDADFAEAYADKWGFPKLEDTQIKEIEKLAKEVQDAHEGYQKFEKIQDLLAYTENVKGIDMGDVYMSMWYSSILSGYRTQGKNFIQNTVTSLFEGAVSTMRHPLYTHRLMQGLGKGWGEGVRQFGHIMATGYNPIKGYKVEVPTVQERFSFKGGEYNPFNWGKYITRLMVAADAFSYAGLKEMRSYEVAMNMARKINKDAIEPTKGTWAKANEILNKTSERVAIAEHKAKGEGLSGVEYKRRVWEFMEQGRPKELIEDAAHFAARGTFNYQPEGTIGMITESISHLTQNAAITIKAPFSGRDFTIRPGKFIVAFTRILANVTNMGLDYYPPIGLGRAALGGIGAKGFEKSDLSKKFYRKYTPEERQKVLIKAMIGVTAQIGLFLLSEPDDDGESAIEITANGYGDYQKNYELKETGWRPYSIKIGGEWFSYQYTPLALALAPIGYFRDSQKYNKKKFNEASIAQMVGLSYFKGIQVINDMSALGSVNSLMDAFKAKDPSQAQSYLRNLATSTAKGFIYPKLAEQTVQMIDELQKNPRRDAPDLIGKIMRDIPIVRSKYNVMLNAVGESVLYDPVQMISTVKSDPFWDYLTEHNVTIGKPGMKETFYDDTTKTERAMTGDEYYNYVRTTGREIKRRIMNEVMTVPNLSDLDVRKLVSSIKFEVRNAYKLENFGWGNLRAENPEAWALIRNIGAIQIPRTNIDIKTEKGKVRLTSTQETELNDKAMKIYAESIVSVLKGYTNDVIEAWKKPDPESGVSEFETDISTWWDSAINDASDVMKETIENSSAK